MVNVRHSKVLHIVNGNIAYERIVIRLIEAIELRGDIEIYRTLTLTLAQTYIETLIDKIEIKY